MGTEGHGSKTRARAWLGRLLSLVLIAAVLWPASLASGGHPRPAPALSDAGQAATPVDPDPVPPPVDAGPAAPPVGPTPIPGEGPAPLQPPPPPGPEESPLPGTGFIPPPMDLSHLTGQRLPRGFRPQALPARFDWRDQGKVTPVKNQGECGSCYAFATVADFESRLLIDGAGAFDLSENHAKECNWRELNDFPGPPGTARGSCDWGNALMVANLFSKMGTVLESCDPYVASDVPCKTTCPYQQTLLGWRRISGNVVPNPQVLKQYIYQHGPVITSMYADGSKGYDSSYDGSFTFNYAAPGTETNHLVLIVGWSDNLPPVPGSSTPAAGWMVKNHWGPGWGADGYFYMTYGAANIGMYASFVHDWQDYDPNGALWYHDEDAWSGAWGAGGTTMWGLARFTAPRDTSVTRVEFWTTDVTTDVDVYLYDSFDGTAPSGLLAQVLNNSFGEAGYHSVPLPQPVGVSSGDDVVAVVKLTNVSYTYPIAMDQHGPPSRRTFTSGDGSPGSWAEAQWEGKYWDAGIRVRTSDLAPGPTVTSITPNSGENTGSVHITNLAGSKFRSGATVKLIRSGQPDIQATNVNVVSASQITCDFDLTGAAAGTWNVVVTNPDSRSGTLPNGFWVTTPVGAARVYLPLGVRYWPSATSTRLGAIADTTILQGFPNMYYGAELSMWAGYDPCWDGRISRSLAAFDTSSLPRGATIVNATLHLELILTCDYAPSDHVVTAYRIRDNWDPNGVTWSAQPRHAESYGQAVVSTRQHRGYSMDVTGLVQGWVNGTFSNYGLMLRGPESSAPGTAVMGFATRQYEDGQQAAYIDVTYRLTSAPSGAAPAGTSFPPETSGLEPAAYSLPTPAGAATLPFDQ
jgi:C1A family cysteine protease